VKTLSVCDLDQLLPPQVRWARKMTEVMPWFLET
jgi:hypothetical protein